MTYNKKSIGPVFTFILWLLLFFVICIVGISNVFGLETKTIYSNQTLDNSNQFNYGFVNEGGVDSITTGSVGSRISGKTKYINFYLSQNVALNYTYTIRINFLADDLQPYFSLNHVREISVCNSSSCSASSLVSIKKQNNNGFSTWVELTFNPTQIGSVIGVTLGDNLGSYITGETFFGISSVQIESKNANQDVIDNSTNNTNNIINNNNSHTESIINNNNENTQQIIDQFNTCRDSKNLLNLPDGTYTHNGITAVISNGVITLNGTSTSTSFISIPINLVLDSNFSISLNNTAMGDSVSEVRLQISGSNFRSVLLNVANNKRENLSIYGTYTSLMLRISSGVTITDGIIKPQVELGNISTDYEPYGEQICTNKLDEQNETSKGIFGKIKELFSWLTNPEPADISGAADVAGWLPAGPLDSLINLPLTMLTNINSSLNKTCSPLVVNLPYVNKSVEIPCLNTIFNQITGLNSFWTWVGMIGSVLILYRYLINLYNYYDKLTDLKANFISDWGSV